MADVRSDTNVSFATFPVNPVYNGAVHIGSNSEIRVGWVAGAGAEYAFASNWSVKAEYLYVDLSHLAPWALATTGRLLFVTETILCGLASTISSIGRSRPSRSTDFPELQGPPLPFCAMKKVLWVAHGTRKYLPKSTVLALRGVAPGM